MSEDQVAVLRTEVSRLTRVLEQALDLVVGGSPFGFASGPDAGSARLDLFRKPAAVMGGKALLLSVQHDLQELDLRQTHFPKDICDGAAWNMLRFLLVCRLEERSVSVTDVTSQSHFAMTTALRHLTVLVEGGYCVRSDDPVDARRAWIALSDRAFRKFAEYYEARRLLRWQPGARP